ncbi:hypothetical protein COCCU_14375 (plasmid) [Corynebacterium occultum]|uniref:Uncharacterized protein n=1 Tax=Corynebacterium occultum TaxID=2675219 RepID=A0A6B8WBS8_9CORY|nr:hypothetical protein [Corynebacterium occultum]QGU08765.1 hypothetical protein COCCU_14375 [Corynebacterium occultum]
MTRRLQEGQRQEVVTRIPALWAWLSASAAVLAAVGSVLGLSVPGRLYGQKTSEMVIAVLAQDLVNLFLVAPLMLILAVYARRGSLSSGLCLIGFLAFTVYNYAIYAFSIHFGPLFLIWVAVLGLSVFALIGNLAALTLPGVDTRFSGATVRVPGWLLIVVAVLFALLWLSEIVPDLLNGRNSTSATDWDVPTNPVHVLDLAFFLPAVGAVGVLLLRGHRIGYVAAPGALIWVILTSLPILVTPFVAQARGEEPGWFVLVPIGTLAVATAVIVWRLLHTVGQRPTVSPGA